jgi:hypothetical protein
VFASHQRGEPFAHDHLKPTLGLLLLDHAIKSERSRYPFEFWPASILTRKQPLDQAIGGYTDHHFIRGGLPLDTGRQVRGLAQSQLLLTAASTHLAHHHGTGMNPNAHLERAREAWSECLQHLDNPEPRPHSASGIVFMGSRIAKVDQQSIAQILRDMPPKVFDNSGTCLLVSTYELPVLFRVELSRERGRAYQVTEHYRQLPAFGFTCSGAGLRGCGRCHRTLRLPCSSRTLALAAFGGYRFLRHCYRRATVRTEFRVRQILALTTPAGMRDGSSTFNTKFGSCRILKPTARTAHAAPLLLRTLQGKENAPHLRQAATLPVATLATPATPLVQRIENSAVLPS